MFTPEEIDQHIALERASPEAARVYAKSIGPAAIGLAVQLAQATGLTYEYFLRRWDCPALPKVLRVAGWEWSTDGSKLINPTARLELRGNGPDAIDRCLQIMFGGLGENKKIKPSLTPAERARVLAATGEASIELPEDDNQSSQEPASKPARAGRQPRPAKASTRPPAASGGQVETSQQLSIFGDE